MLRPLKLPGEASSEWHPNRGIHGIYVLQLDKDFTEAVIADVNASGVEFSVGTKAGNITASGDIKKYFILKVAEAVIRQQRYCILRKVGGDQSAEYVVVRRSEAKAKTPKKYPRA